MASGIDTPGDAMKVRYGPASVEQTLGALPVVAGFCQRLDIAGIIDRAAPVREIAYATHGQVIEALIANRLTSPAPMIHVGGWARQFAVGHALGLDADVLTTVSRGRWTRWRRCWTR